MQLLKTIVEFVVVTICLPFYAIIFPIMRWGDGRAAKQIASMNCPHCESMMSSITWRDLKPCMVRLRITAGTKVVWDRMPQRAVMCPACNKQICFDRKLRYTACDMSDAITRRTHPASSNLQPKHHPDRQITNG